MTKLLRILVPVGCFVSGVAMLAYVIRQVLP